MKRRELLTGATALAVAGGVTTLAGCAAPSTLPVAPAALPQVPAGQPLRSIGLGSCIDQTKPQPIWDAVLAQRPDLFIFGGDNVYASAQPWSLDKLKQAYAQQAAVPGFARLRQTIPHMAIWDDHDYGLNDGGAEFPHKEASKAAFLEFWRVPFSDMRRSFDGLFDAQVFGPPGQRVQVIMLDTRSFRSPLKETDQRNAPGKERYVPDANPSKTMLGITQWRWLSSQLRVPAEVRLIVSGIQVVAEGHGFERWGNLPLERENLYRLIQSAGATGVVFLSGDRHIGAIYRETSGTPYPFYELTSSGITHPWREASEAGPNRLALYTDIHYGTVDIDWPSRALTLALRDVRGQVQRQQRIDFSELKIPS